MDLKHVAELVNAPALDVDSQIKIDFSMVLNLLLSHTPEQVRTLLDNSFASYLIAAGEKRSKAARKRFGQDLALLWNDFLAHMEFLMDEGFLTREGRLTEDGLWASKLRIDVPLLVAQAIRLNLLPDQDPALLAAIMASFVNEKEFKDDLLFEGALPKRLKTGFLDIRKGLKPFALKLLSSGFSAPNLFVQPAFLMYGWAHDTPWDELMTGADYAEGDFARLILRTAENLRQIAKIGDSFPNVAKTAALAVDMILKEPVITQYH